MLAPTSRFDSCLWVPWMEQWILLKIPCMNTKVSIWNLGVLRNAVLFPDLSKNLNL